MFKGVLTIISIAFFGCAEKPEEPMLPPQDILSPLVETDPDIATEWEFDPAVPFTLDFGRGSGLQGLDTITVTNLGEVTLHRLRNRFADGFWETSAFTLSPDETTQIGREIARLNLQDVPKAYHADISDGTQWVLWIRQGQSQKSVYFNNHFPEAIRNFAERIDQILKIDYRELSWNRVPKELIGKHDEEIWKSIE